LRAPTTISSNLSDDFGGLGVEVPVIRPTARSWALPAPDGAYARVLAWNGRAKFLDAVMDDLATPGGEQARKTERIKASTYLKFAALWAESADSGTGRGVTLSRATTAQKAGMSVSTTERAQRLLTARGFSVTVAVGRHLTTAERLSARHTHGKHQAKAASTRALTLPRHCFMKNEDLSRRDKAFKNSHLLKIKQNQRARGKRTAAPRPNSQYQPSTAKSGAGRTGYRPWSETEYRFAVTFSSYFPWLQRSRHPASVCGMLKRAGIVTSRWTPADLKRRIDAGIPRAWIKMVIDPGEQRDPLAYMAWLIKLTIDPAMPTPTEEATIATERRAAQQVEYKAEREADQQLRLTIAAQADEIAAIIAESNARYR